MGIEKDLYKVYALVSLSNERIYVGMSTDVERRVKEHNSKKVFSTKAYVPWKLFHVEHGGNAQSARALEKYYKSASGKRKLRKILETLDSGSLPD